MVFENYNILIEFNNIEDGNKKEAHGKYIPKTDRKCLFCGSEKATFHKEAHAISETIGNKTLISHYECDECNERFGKAFEDGLGKYMLPYKIVTQSFGKGKQLVAKDHSFDNELSYGTYKVQINRTAQEITDELQAKGYIIEKSGTGIVNMTEDGFDIKILRQKYNPQAVFCAFLKMAYSILPLELYPKYVKKFVSLFLVASNDDEKMAIMNNNSNVGILAFTPGDNPLQGINVKLWERSVSETENVPNLLFTDDSCNIRTAFL